MKLFLVSTNNINEKGAHSIFVGCSENESPKIISLKDINLEEKELILFNSPPIINYLRENKIELPYNIVDILQIFKLVKGKTIKYHKYPELQVMWIMLNEFFEDKEELKSVLNTMNSSKDEIIFPIIEEKLITLNSYLIKIYFLLLKELKLLGEYDRYKMIEKPFNYILISRQYNGIFLNQKVLTEKIEKTRNELNILNKRLRYEFDIINPQSVIDIKHALQKKNYRFISKVINAIDNKSVWNLVKTGMEQDEFLRILYDAYRISFDVISLTKIIVESDGKVYPFFDCNGTVTSRTLVRMPLIQQLKKTSRDIFSAKEGFSLLYADYSQFEPGILADLANDEKLIECYNHQDLYSSLSVELFGNQEHRSFCKIIFLSFMYGMSNAGLEHLVNDFFNEHGSNRKEDLQHFFSRFTNLIPYKMDLQKIALEEKRIGSCLGNHRYFNSKFQNHLPNKVKRWVLSQKIQGTASVILKTAILNCCKDEKIEFLIPMHDAALFQVPTELLVQKKEIIKKEFEDAMLYYCPKLKPKVVFKKFTE